MVACTLAKFLLVAHSVKIFYLLHVDLFRMNADIPCSILSTLYFSKIKYMKCSFLVHKRFLEWFRLKSLTVHVLYMYRPTTCICFVNVLFMFCFVPYMQASMNFSMGLASMEQIMIATTLEKWTYRKHLRIK